MRKRELIAPIGSSPRVWGTVEYVQDDGDEGRFIPTRVGNRGYAMFLPAVAPVHPHACGEQDPLLAIHHVDQGSSPRVWGTDLVSLADELEIRFIPTRVGNRARAARAR